MYLSCAMVKVFDLITTGSVTVAKAEEKGNKRDIWDAQEEECLGSYRWYLDSGRYFSHYRDWEGF